MLYHLGTALALMITFQLCSSCAEHTKIDESQKEWMVGPFIKIDEANPCLAPDPEQMFLCPLSGSELAWEAKDVFNPAAVKHNGQIKLIYRSEDYEGPFKGTSRLGLAYSNDGLNFLKHPAPILYPMADAYRAYEWPGGVEDPRVVFDSESERYIMTYTAYDGKTARLMVAWSKDLKSWTKEGLAFHKEHQGKFDQLWSKSGSIVTRIDRHHNFVAHRINGLYWMYWGDTQIYLASSKNLIDWRIHLSLNNEPQQVMHTRLGFFDSQLIEPGPQAVLTSKGILLIYNSQNARQVGSMDTNLPPGSYNPGQALFSMTNPSQLIDRSNHHFMRPDKPYEIDGQVNQVCFVEGMVIHNDDILLYYGTADSKIAVAKTAFLPEQRDGDELN